jgi:hypothetical protein
MKWLIDIIPSGARRHVYGALTLVGVVYGTWQAADGNWKATVTALISAAVTALAHANTNGTPDEEP